MCIRDRLYPVGDQDTNPNLIASDVHCKADFTMDISRMVSLVDMYDLNIEVVSAEGTTGSGEVTGAGRYLSLIHIQYIPNGPYHVDGRDDTVSIHPTNFNQAPVASFTWHEETGEIISFNVATRKKLKALDVAKKSQIDGETKSLDSGVTQTDGSLPDNSVDGITGETIPSNAPNTYDSRVDGIPGAATRPSTDKYLSLIHIQMCIRDSKRYSGCW